MACAGSTPTFVDSESLSYSANTCTLAWAVNVTIACGASGYKIRWYIKKGSPPLGVGSEIACLDQALGAGPAVEGHAAVIPIHCQGTGTFYVMTAIICDGVNLLTSTESVTVSADSSTVPSVSNINARVVNNVGNCTCQVDASIRMPCGSPNSIARLYMSRGGPPAIVPNNLVGADIALGCGLADRSVSWSGIRMDVDGKWYFRVAVLQSGVSVAVGDANITVQGCEKLQPITPSTAVPHSGVDELIYLVRPVKSGGTYTFEDRRVLSLTYQMVDWWYSRNGGCGNFRLLLRETFVEAPAALEEGWEVHVRIKLSGDTTYTTWYRGVIRAVEVMHQGNEILTEVRGQGYLEQLASVQIQRRYPKGQQVSQIINDILNNYVIGTNTRILNSGNLDAATYATAGPLHFECSALKAIKFLSELQGSMEFGIATDRTFYLRSKKTQVEDGFFSGESSVVNVLDGGTEVEKLNMLKIGGKQWGHDEELTIISDITDISNYGLYERPIDVPWIEHRQDAIRWAQNVIGLKKTAGIWQTLALSNVSKRTERNHPTTGLSMVRIYGTDVSNDFNDLDVTKIHYYKGGFVHKSEVREIHRPKASNLIDQPVLRAILYAGTHHHDLVEEMEERLYEPLSALKAKDKQFRNPRVDPTNPDVNEIQTIPGQLWLQPKVADVTNGPFRMRFREDLTNWPDLVKMRLGDALPSSGDFVGEEFIVYSDAARTKGLKYYWNGFVWVAIAIQKELTPAQITADQNDYDPESSDQVVYSMWRLNTNASRNISGIKSAFSSRQLTIVNVGSNPLVLQNQNASSQTQNRIITGTGGNITISPDDSAILMYDFTSQRWRVIA